MRLLENSNTRNLYNILNEDSSKEDLNFEELVKRDFRLYLMDKYGDELYKDVTEDDVNEYFTGMFYDIWDSDDLDSANEAEQIIRKEYGLLDNINESAKNLKEDFWNPGKYFLLLQDMENIDGDLWNKSSKEERENMVRPFLEEFWNKYKEEMSDSDIEALFNDMEDSNYHTEYRILRDIIEKDAYKMNESFSHITSINYGDDDSSEIEMVVDNRDEFKELDDETIHNAFKNDNLSIMNNDLSGEEYMFDIPIVDNEGYYLEFKEKGEDGKYHFIITKANEEISFDEIESRMSNAESYDELYDAVSLIQDPKIRKNAEEMLDTCKKDGDDVSVAYSVTTTEYIDPYRNELNIIKESVKTLKEDSVVWSNTATEDYYSNLTREEMIKEIKDNGWDEEEINGKPILDADDEELRDYLIPQDIDLDYEDYENSIEPMIEKQCYENILVLSGTAANWRGSGAACKAMKVDDLKSYLMPNYDASIKLYCDKQDNLYYTEANHDTPMGGTEMYLYSLHDESSYTNAEAYMKEYLEDEEFDMYYFIDYVNNEAIDKMIESGILKPIKRDPNYVGITESVKLNESKKNKNKKDDVRVVMQQGNVTCIKENDSFYVFENESDNEVEYDNQDEAMSDFMNRVGVNPEDELKEE